MQRFEFLILVFLVWLGGCVSAPINTPHNVSKVTETQILQQTFLLSRRLPGNCTKGTIFSGFSTVSLLGTLKSFKALSLESSSNISKGTTIGYRFG